MKENNVENLKLRNISAASLNDDSELVSESVFMDSGSGMGCGSGSDVVTGNSDCVAITIMANLEKFGVKTYTLDDVKKYIKDNIKDNKVTENNISDVLEHFFNCTVQSRPEKDLSGSFIGYMKGGLIPNGNGLREAHCISIKLLSVTQNSIVGYDDVNHKNVQVTYDSNNIGVIYKIDKKKQ